jgi:hypothetical protein
MIPLCNLHFDHHLLQCHPMSHVLAPMDFQAILPAKHGDSVVQTNTLNDLPANMISSDSAFAGDDLRMSYQKCDRN